MSATGHILLVAAATSTSGGGERHIADLLRLLPTRGFRVSLVCPPGGDLPGLARSLDIKVREIPIADGLSSIAVLALRRAIRELAPDLVHAHGSRAAFFARLADPRAARRCVYTLHGIHVDKAGSPVRRFVFMAIERALRRRAARFVTVCASDLSKGARLCVIDEVRTSVVYNGIAPADASVPRGVLRAELGIGPEVPLALSVGRFHEQKDQRTLLSAWALVHARYPEAVLALIGAGPLESALREQCDALGLTGSVRFLPPRPDLAPAYADADAFVLTSLWEGLPYVVLEAMSHGLPVAAPSVDGIPEAVVDRESGILFPPADPAAAATAVITLLDDPARAAAMGEAGRARVAESFGLDAMVDATLAVYRQVVSH